MGLGLGGSREGGRGRSSCCCTTALYSQGSSTGDAGGRNDLQDGGNAYCRRKSFTSLWMLLLALQAQDGTATGRAISDFTSVCWC